MKRIGVLLGILLIVLIPASISLAIWTGMLVVSNNSTTSYTMFPATVSTNVTYLINNHYITSNGSDTKVQVSASDVPFMLAQDRINFANPLPNNSNVNASFLTGQNTTANFSIITGYGGSITTNFTAALDMGKNYSMPLGVYLSGTGNIEQNDHGLNVSYNATSGNVTTFIKKDTATSTSDGYATKNSGIYNTAWIATNADSVNSTITLPVGQRFALGSYDIYRSFMFFNTANISGNITSAILYLYLNADSSTTDFDVVIQKGSSGHPTDPLVVGDYDKTFYSGNYGSFNTAGLAAGYNAIPITDTSFINAGTTTNITIRSSNDIAGVAPAGDEFVNFESADAGAAKQPILYITFTLNSISGITQGYHVITPYADSVHAWTTVDSTSSGNTTAITTTDTITTDKYIFGSTATPYFNYIKMVIGGVEKLWYQPTSIINGTNLPDRDGTKDGDITWGSNPSGVSSTVQSFTPSVSVIPNNTGESSQDVAPTISANETAGKVNPKTAVVPTTPISPLMVFLAGQYAYNLPLFVLWVLVAFVVTTIVFAFSLSLFNHMGLAGFLGSATWGLFIVMVGLPHLYLSLSVLGFLVGLVQENRG